MSSNQSNQSLLDIDHNNMNTSLLLLVLSSSLVLGRRSRLVTSCSLLEDSAWNDEEVGDHLLAWLQSLVTLRNTSQTGPESSPESL